MQPVVFSPEWFAQHQRWLLRLLAWPLVGRVMRRVLAIRPHDVGWDRPIVELLPHAYTVANPDGTFTMDCRTHAKYGKRLYYQLLPFWALLHAWDMVVANSLVPALNAGFDTLTAYPDPGNPGTTTCDAWLDRNGVDETLSTLRGGVGNQVGTDTALYVWLQASTTSNQFARCIRSGALFDTSSLTASAIVSSATLSLWCLGGNLTLGTPGVVVSGFTPASNTSLAASDYQNVGLSTSYGSIASGGVDTSNTVYSVCTLNSAGRSAIAKTGVTKCALTSDWDFNNSFTGSWASGAGGYLQFWSSDQTGSSNDPKLEVTFIVSQELQPRNALRPRVFAPGRPK